MKREILQQITNEVQRTSREYFENLYFNKLENLGKMTKFLQTCDLLKLNQEDISNLHRSKTRNEIESIIKKNSQNKKSV
jgi:hypothetical protein